MLTVDPRNCQTGGWGLHDRCSARLSSGRNAVSVVASLLAGPLSRPLGGLFLCGLGGLVSCDPVGLDSSVPGGLLNDGFDVHGFCQEEI